MFTSRSDIPFPKNLTKFFLEKLNAVCDSVINDRNSSPGEHHSAELFQETLCASIEKQTSEYILTFPDVRNKEFLNKLMRLTLQTLINVILPDERASAEAFKNVLQLYRTLLKKEEEQEKLRKKQGR